MKETISFLLLLIGLQICFASDHQDSIVNHDKKIIHSLSVNIGAEYVASSIGDDIREIIENDDKIHVNTSLPVNFRYSFSFNNPEIPYYYPESYQGISVGILNFGALQIHGMRKSYQNIGYPVAAYVFQGAPFYHINERISLNYEWNFGAAIGWRPYSDKNKYFNLTVGSQVNAYLHLGLDMQYRIDEQTSLLAGIGVSHFSNGNTSFPNPGINSFGIRLGMLWALNPPQKYIPYSSDTIVEKKKIEYNITLWGASRKRVYRGNENPVLLPGRYACAGISFSPLVKLNTWWRVGGSIDLQWDQSSGLKRYYEGGTTTEDIRFSKASVWRQINCGLAVHGELRMPIFAVNIGCGYNLISPIENRGTYQNITLKTYIGNNFYINVGYQLLNFYRQSNLMLGAGVAI